MKTIKSKKDLAINGAPPAFDHPIHVGGPNVGERADFLKYVDDIFERRRLTNNGPLVQELERRIADYLNVKHCISMCNGTIALEIAIRALGLEGEVIVPSYTFIATAHALHWQAITPVFADIVPETHNLDPVAVKKLITPRTSGIIGVHLWGRAAPVDELQSVASDHGLKLMFDAAHAFGCSYKGSMIGNFGACEVLSFHATKFFNTFEGGAVVTNDDKLAEAMRLMRNFGFSGYDNVVYPGTNGKMMEIAAAMGLVNFNSIPDVIQINSTNYFLYSEWLKGLDGILLLPYDENERNNFQYVVLEITEDCPVNRDEIVRILHAENVLARKYFWPGCHKMKPFLDLNPTSNLRLPKTEMVSNRVLVLPTGSLIDEDSIFTISSILRTICQRG